MRVDHDLSNAVVLDQVLQRTQADGLVQHFLGKAARIDGFGQIAEIAFQDVVDQVDRRVAQRLVVHAAHVDAAQVELPDQRRVHLGAPDVHVRVRVFQPRQLGGCDVSIRLRRSVRFRPGLWRRRHCREAAIGLPVHRRLVRGGAVVRMAAGTGHVQHVIADAYFVGLINRPVPGRHLRAVDGDRRLAPQRHDVDAVDFPNQRGVLAGD